MITITGRIPSKKNARQAINMGGRCILIPNKLYKEWHRDALIEVAQQVDHKAQPFGKEIRIVMFAPDARKFDLTNKAESCMDLLVDAHVIEDDNYEIVPRLILEFGGIDRENPRAEIYG